MAKPTSAKYFAPEDAEAERPVKVSTEAGRKCVRSIYSYPILSQEWVALVDQLRQLARLVGLEARMPANAKVSELQGRNTQSGGTLWDQEVNENAIRILVEEAKLNLCIRMMNDYKKWCYGGDRQNEIKMAADKMGVHPPQVKQVCVHYEESLGLLLEKSFEHVETLQLIDIQLLVEHCAMVLENALKVGPELVCDKAQETVVLLYISSLMKHSEQLSNPELLAKTRELRILPMVTQHALQHGEKYPPEMIHTIVEGLSALADNEDFSTNWESYFLSESYSHDPEMQSAFLQLEGTLVSWLLAQYPDKRREIRPLLDFFNTVKRALR